MSEDRDKPLTPEDAELEREVRSKRRFSLAEAIGREGADLMKGASPVTRKRQVELEITQFLERHLVDGDGALRVVMVRRLRESEVLLATDYDALAALTRVTEGIVASKQRLMRLVTAVDAEWGRMYLERPYFDPENKPPHRKDPYTAVSVKAKLLDLLEQLERAASG